MNEIHSDKYLRTRRFRVMLPVLILPIATVFFWLMGGGTVNATGEFKKGGLNTQLPEAKGGRDSAKDKLAFYDAADSDSSKREEQIRMDPYRRDSTGYEEIRFAPINKTYRATHSSNAIESKIASIQKQLASTEGQEPVYTETKSSEASLLKKNVVPETDPEIEVLSGMLDKLAAIQSPQKTNMQDNRVVQRGLAVSTDMENDTTYFGKKKVHHSSVSFYNEGDTRKEKSLSITAVVPTQQVLQSGSVVKLELRSGVAIKGIVLPAGTFVFGIASLEGERLMIHIPSVRYQDHLLPVSLKVYDLDGLEGIYVPGSLSRDVVKSTADNAIQSAGISGFDLSIKTQAAAAGIGAAKSLLSKKVKQVRFTLSAGYQVLLNDNNQSFQ